MTVHVSIIIPVYNVENYLLRTLQSCTGQTLQDIEIIIVNDGSTDNSLKIIENFTEKDKRIKFINKQNEGVTMARKDGLAIATGEYIFYLDGDDYLTNDALEILYAQAKEMDADWVAGDFYLEFENQNLTERKFFDFGCVNNIDFLKYCFEHRDFYFMGRLIRSTLLKSLVLDIPANITYGEDNLAVVQIGYNLHKAAKVNKPILYYVQRQNSVTNQLKKKDLILRTMAVKHQLKFLKEKGIYNKISKEVIIFMVNEIYYQIVTGYVDYDLSKEFLNRPMIKKLKRIRKLSNKQYFVLLVATSNLTFTIRIIQFLKKLFSKIAKTD